MAWDLSNYEAVEDRIDRFYKEHQDGRILTEIHTLTTEKVMFKAYIYLSDVLVATGFAYEKDGSSLVNKTSHIENAETSAIGRALANYNYAIAFPVEIYNCYINGKCDSKYLLQYCISMVATAFMMELRKVQYGMGSK